MKVARIDLNMILGILCLALTLCLAAGLWRGQAPGAVLPEKISALLGSGGMGIAGISFGETRLFRRDGVWFAGRDEDGLPADPRKVSSLLDSLGALKVKGLMGTDGTAWDAMGVDDKGTRIVLQDDRGTIHTLVFPGPGKEPALRIEGDPAVMALDVNPAAYLETVPDQWVLADWTKGMSPSDITELGVKNGSAEGTWHRPSGRDDDWTSDGGPVLAGADADTILRNLTEGNRNGVLTGNLPAGSGNEWVVELKGSGGRSAEMRIRSDGDDWIVIPEHGPVSIQGHALAYRVSGWMAGMPLLRKLLPSGKG